MRARVGAAAAALFALLLALVAYVPLAPEPIEQEPDISFRATTHDAFARHLQLGTDIVSTYGPWGILQRGFDPRTDRVVLGVSALLALAFAWGVIRIARDAGGGALVISIASVTAAALVVAGGLDARFAAIALLLLLSTLESPSLGRELPLVAALGWIALIKFSLLMLAAFAVMMLVVRRRRFLHGAVFLAAFIVAWLLAGQHIAGLPLFFLRGADVAGGYAGASALGSGIPLATAGVAGLALLAAAIERTLLGTITIGGAAWYFLKIGYVRADTAHTRVANALLLLLTIGYLLLRRDAIPRLRRLIVVLAAAGMVAAIITGGPLLADRAREQWSWMHDRSQRLTQLENEAAIRSGASELPAINGTIDAYPWGSAALIARKMKYTPRPVFQSCMAWTPALAKLNASDLGNNAPEWIWAGVGSIDGRLPMLDDAPSWLEIARRYEVVSAGEEHLLLHRRAAAKPLAFAPSGLVTARFGGDVPLPAGDALWCAIEMRPTIATRIRDVFGRPPVVTMEMTTSDGARTSWRVPVAMLRGGFLISPQIVSTADLAAFLRNQRGRWVRSVRVMGGGYGETVTLQIDKFRISNFE